MAVKVAVQQNVRADVLESVQGDVQLRACMAVPGFVTDIVLAGVACLVQDKHIKYLSCRAFYKKEEVSCLYYQNL